MSLGKNYERKEVRHNVADVDKVECQTIDIAEVAIPMGRFVDWGRIGWF
jgi:hypothetical protein